MDILNQEQIDPEDIATWLLQRYLQALQSRAIPWNDQSDSDWPILNRLHKNLRDQLPSEYSLRLDEVSPRSMGSAKIVATTITTATRTYFQRANSSMDQPPFRVPFGTSELTWNF